MIFLYIHRVTISPSSLRKTSTVLSFFIDLSGFDIHRNRNMQSMILCDILSIVIRFIHGVVSVTTSFFLLLNKIPWHKRSAFYI
jgi:hypothetical protein